MSRILWKGLLVSPAVLAASLVLSSASLAAEQPMEIAAATQANNLQLADVTTEAAKAETEALTADQISLATNNTVKTIENANAISQPATTPENTVAADLSTTEPVAEDLGDRKYYTLFYLMVVVVNNLICLALLSLIVQQVCTVTFTKSIAPRIPVKLILTQLALTNSSIDYR